MAGLFIESQYQQIGDMVMEKTMSWVVGKHTVQILVLKGMYNINEQKTM